MGKGVEGQRASCSDAGQDIGWKDRPMALPAQKEVHRIEASNPYATTKITPCRSTLCIIQKLDIDKDG